MPVMITCPTCKGTVRLLRGGAVAMHFDNEGDLCPFTQTARSAERKAPKRYTPEQRAEILGREKKRVPGEKPSKARQPADEGRPKVECSKCQQVVRLAKKADGTLEAHRRQSGRWCTGGAAPSEKQMKAVGRGRSVWTVSGGLPTLGKRR